MARIEQVGGDHYSQAENLGAEQHWDRAAKLGLNYFQAAGSKYGERAYLKGSAVEDLRKGASYFLKLADLIEAGTAHASLMPTHPDDPHGPGREPEPVPVKTTRKR